MRLTACDQCGYLLDAAQARTRCPECGLSVHRQHREDALRIVGRPAYLALLALVFWRPLPLALWSTRASARLIRSIRRDSRRLCIWTLILGAVLAILPGSIIANEWEILEKPAGYYWRDYWYDFWGLFCSRGTSTRPSPDLSSLLRAEGARTHHPYELAWMPLFDPICGRWRIGWAQVTMYSLPTLKLVCLPAAAYMLSLLILSFVTRQATHRAGEIRLSRLSRATLMAAASSACLTPLRLAWFVAFLVSVPFLLAPSAGLPVRRVVWYCLILFATMGPSLIAARIVLADRPGNYIRRRRLVSLMLVVLGCVVPSILGREVLHSVNFMLSNREVELKRLHGAYPAEKRAASVGVRTTLDVRPCVKEEEDGRVMSTKGVGNLMCATCGPA